MEKQHSGVDNIDADEIGADEPEEVFWFACQRCKKISALRLQNGEYVCALCGAPAVFVKLVARDVLIKKAKAWMRKQKS